MTALEEIREHDGDGYFGGLMAYHLSGHGHDLDVVERAVEEEMQEYGHEPPVGGWEVRERWVYKTPVRDEYGARAGWQATYVDAPRRGAKAVTVIDMVRGPGHWCYNHPEEPWATALPATRFIDGETMVVERLAQHATEVEPRTSVEPPPTSPWAGNQGGSIYLCRACHLDVEERARAASRRPVSA